MNDKSIPFFINSIKLKMFLAKKANKSLVAKGVASFSSIHYSK